MSKEGLLGIYKVLSPNEELIFENKSLTPVVLVKEAFIKKVLKRTETREMPLSYSLAKTYLTNKRLIFLILYQLSSKYLGDEEASNDIAGVVGTWFEVPVSAIVDYHVRPLMLKENVWQKDMWILEQWGIADTSQRQSLMEIIYDEKQATGRSKDYVEAMMQRGMFSKLFGKVEKISDKIFILGHESATLAPSLKQFCNSKVSQSNDENIFCSKCGAKQIEMESRFCSKCGQELQSLKVE